MENVKIDCRIRGCLVQELEADITGRLNAVPVR